MDECIPDFSSMQQELTRLWDTHRCADWPKDVGAHEGELMTIDTVLGGCVNFFLEEETLDPPRLGILSDCLKELDDLLENMERETKEYFERLRTIGSLLIKMVPSPSS